MSMSPKPAIIPPTSARGGANTPAKNPTTNTTSSAAIALNMSWQLLVILVLPLAGGYWLDQHFDMSPIWTCVGMVVAVVGSIVVVRQTVRMLNELNGTDDTPEEPKA